MATQRQLAALGVLILWVTAALIWLASEEGDIQVTVQQAQTVHEHQQLSLADP